MSSTFKIYFKFEHFSTSPLLSPSTKPPSQLAWKVQLVSQLDHCSLPVSSPHSSWSGTYFLKFSDYTVPLLKTLQWFLITLVIYKTPHDVPLPISLNTLLITPLLIYYALTDLTFLFISQRAEISMIALLFLLPGKFYISVFAWLPPALDLGFCWNIISLCSLSLITSPNCTPSHSHIISPF